MHGEGRELSVLVYSQREAESGFVDKVRKLSFQLFSVRIMLAYAWGRQMVNVRVGLVDKKGRVRFLQQSPQVEFPTILSK